MTTTQNLRTRLSPQWWSGRLTTQHDVLTMWLPIWLQFRRGTFRPSGLGDMGGRGWAHSIASPWVANSSLLTHMVHLLPFLSYLAGSKSVSVRPHTMSNTALEAIASSSGKNRMRNNERDIKNQTEFICNLQRYLQSLRSSACSKTPRHEESSHGMNVFGRLTVLVLKRLKT